MLKLSPLPTQANIPYGKHERQVLEFWQVKSEKPNLVVIKIHGGGSCSSGLLFFMTSENHFPYGI